MSVISLKDVHLKYPLLGGYARSLKTSFLQLLYKRSAREIEQIKYIEALKGINLELRDGDRLGLIGNNGAGKSTLLKVMAGIYFPSQGKVHVEGSLSSLLGLNVGMNPHTTGYENIELKCLLHGCDRKKIKEIILDIEEFTELGKFLPMPAKTYSSGMNLRLAFGLATAVAPEILLIDEVVGVGDARFLEKAQNRLNKLILDSKILVLSSHSNEIIKKFCNKVLWLENGKILYVGGNVEETLQTYHQRVTDDIISAL